MKLTKYSKNRFFTSLNKYGVILEWGDVLYNYFVFGYQPGSFLTALLANDARDMIAHSHPSNSIEAMKSVVTWLNGELISGIGFGSYPAVKKWLAMTPKKRRRILEDLNLIYSEEQEIMMVLKDEPESF